MKILRRTQFGNKILRDASVRLTEDDIRSDKTQQFIKDMYYTLSKKKYGVGLAAPQVGRGLAVSVIWTKATPTRPELKEHKMTIINPVVTKTYGSKTGMWEGCISGTNIYAKAMRYKKVRLAWQDENAKQHEQDFDGFLAHVIQHEVDHLNGILFVDRVKDTKTYMTFSEYEKLIKQEEAK